MAANISLQYLVKQPFIDRNLASSMTLAGIKYTAVGPTTHHMQLHL